jgi:release factor glutamine methyltransferase
VTIGASGMTIGDALARATARLAEAGVDSARLESELLLARACDDCARALLYAELNREMTDEQLEAFDANIVRREKREPLAYILGEWGFRRLTLKTDRRALIPRPETEIVVERALEHVRDIEEPEVLDVGTGTGAIALAIADELPAARVTAMDVSDDALSLARENLELTGVNGRVRLVEHDLTSGLGEANFDLVVSNPPYVEPDELPRLQPEVRDWEPHVALVASGATEKLAQAATEALRPGGWLVLEVAAGAGERVERLLSEVGFENVRITPDLAGRDRVAEGRWIGATI